MKINIDSKSTKEEKIEALSKEGNEISWNFCDENGRIKIVDAIVSDAREFRKSLFVYCDIQNKSGLPVCFVTEAFNNVYVIFRNKDVLMNKMKLNTSERRCIYYHEIAHKLSPNQKKANRHLLENEIDADSFAINEFGANPVAMRSALIKTYQFFSSEEVKAKNTKEAIESGLAELRARIKNIEKIIIRKRKLEKTDLTR